ncbi:MAG: hypothetical protein FJ104_17120 [Deltaproteobacteria bacterium]|nr:hypothetical protein [Deltaproteobacteria bacterium]
MNVLGAQFSRRRAASIATVVASLASLGTPDVRWELQDEEALDAIELSSDVPSVTLSVLVESSRPPWITLTARPVWERYEHPDGIAVHMYLDDGSPGVVVGDGAASTRAEFPVSGPESWVIGAPITPWRGDCYPCETRLLIDIELARPGPDDLVRIEPTLRAGVSGSETSEVPKRAYVRIVQP